MAVQLARPAIVRSGGNELIWRPIHIKQPREVYVRTYVCSLVMRIVTYPDMNMVHVRVTKEHVGPGNTRTVGEHGTREPCNQRPSEPETQESKDPGVRGPRKQTHTGAHANNTHIRTLNTHTETQTCIQAGTDTHAHTCTLTHTHKPWNQQTHKILSRGQGNTHAIEKRLPSSLI